MTDDHRPRGSCVIPGCPRDPYPRGDGRLPLVCGPDRAQGQHWLREIPALADELGRQLTDASVPDPRGKDISVWLPAGPLAAAARGGRVSGSPVPRLPIDVDEVDLLAARRPLMAEPGRRGEDQAGWDSVWSVLSFWAADLAEHRNRGERGQRPRDASPIPWLAGWLLDRFDEAADDWPGYRECWTDLRRVHGALRAQLGLIDVPDHKAGVSCPRCHAQRLVQLGGEVVVRCQACPTVLLESEYLEHVKTMARKVTRVKLNKATVSVDAGAERACSLQITTHMVDVSTFSGVTEPDPAWTLVDAAGHFHAWDHQGNLPTLREHTVWTAYDVPDEDTGATGYETTTMRCRICDVPVEPGTVTTHDVGKQLTPGRTEWLIEFDGTAPYECSLVVRTPDKVFFGVANCYERGPGKTTAVGSSMSWRKPPKEPEPAVVPSA